MNIFAKFGILEQAGGTPAPRRRFSKTGRPQPGSLKLLAGQDGKTPFTNRFPMGILYLLYLGRPSPAYDAVRIRRTDPMRNRRNVPRLRICPALPR